MSEKKQTAGKPGVDYNKLIKAGDYTAVAKKYFEKKNSKGTGRNAAIMYVIEGGEFDTFAAFLNINNIVHKSKQAQEIAEETMSKALLAAGVTQPLSEIERMDIQDLVLDKPVVITVDVEPERTVTIDGKERTFKSRNVVSKVSAI